MLAALAVPVTISVAPSAAAKTVDAIAVNDTDLDVSFIFHAFRRPPGGSGR